MKKYLISATVLAGLAASSAFANAPTVSVGGLIDFQAAGRHQKAPYKTNMSANNKSSRFHNNAQLYMKAEGKADAGFTYGGVASIASNADNSKRADIDNNLNKTYLYLETGMGRIELGSNYSAGESMRISAGSVARGTGGVAGDSLDYVNVGEHLTTPKLLGDVMASNSKEEIRKVAYFTPKMNGFQAGLSFAPDLAVSGDENVKSSFTPTVGAHSFKLKNHFSGGLGFTHQMDQVNLALSAIGEVANSNRTLNQDLYTTLGQYHKANLKGWMLGAKLDYAGWGLAGSYGSTNKSALRTDTTTRLKNTKHWSVGASYAQGPFGLGVGYLESDMNRNKFKNVSVSADYALAPGMMPYVEASFFTAKNADRTVIRNKGKVYLVGTQFKF